ncbi:hypothetical protein [Helicobacter labetoulli]|uniref:hypothetical protein n=1 Tax=Helicobacter labetoulli TaxID=2315333 RepID=UPI0013007B14|nr:hypothetical protein [Helicobacter labetoulli]
MDTIGTAGEVADLVRGGGKLGGIRKAFKGSPSQTGNAGGGVINTTNTFGNSNIAPFIAKNYFAIIHHLFATEEQYDAA